MQRCITTFQQAQDQCCPSLGRVRLLLHTATVVMSVNQAPQYVAEPHSGTHVSLQQPKKALRLASRSAATSMH